VWSGISLASDRFGETIPDRMPSPAIPDDRDGFRRLYEVHGEAVFRLLYRLTRNAHDAEDLVQDTFTRAWTKRRQFRGDGSVEGYLRKIAYRTYLNARIRLGRARSAASLFDADLPHHDDNPSAMAERSLDRRHLLDRVRAAVDVLPASWREPFVLFRYEGLTCAEVGEMLGISTKAAEIRVARALHSIGASLDGLRHSYGGAPA
jgi:RNA polymerase sigma factor (sigma-70 family)